MIRVIGPKDPKDPQAINVTSRSTTWSRGLSPFFLGPIPLYQDHISNTMENAWQFSKVYKCHLEPDGSISPEYWKWAQHGWQNHYAARYPMGRGAIPEFLLWDNQRLSYIEARRKVYIPLYTRAVFQTSAFRQLREIYKELHSLTLWDFDGYDHRSLGMSYQEVVDCPTRKCGHGFVLAMMLEKLYES